MTTKRLMTDEQRTTEPEGEKKPPKRTNTPAEALATTEGPRKSNAAPTSTRGVRSGMYAVSTQSGRLPKGHAKLQRLVDSFYREWVEDLGGEENLTGAKRAVLWVARGCLAVFALGLEDLKNRGGLVDPQGNVSDVVKVLATYGNSLRLHLTAVGLNRVPRNVTKDLQSRLEEIAATEEEENRDETAQN